jgi:predicted DsbA family dithiol-disulfide isomerase
MSLALELYFDHTCPYSYMAFEATGRVARRRRLPVRWRPVPFIRGDAPFTPAETAMLAVRQEASWPRVAALAASGFGLRIERPASGAGGRLAAAASHWAVAKTPERAESVHRALFEACFGTGGDVDIGTIEGICAALTAACSDTSGLADAIASGATMNRLAADVAAAEAGGVSVVPTLLAGRFVLVGAQPEAVIERGLEQVARQRRDEAP